MTRWTQTFALGWALAVGMPAMASDEVVEAPAPYGLKEGLRWNGYNRVTWQGRRISPEDFADLVGDSERGSAIHEERRKANAPGRALLFVGAGGGVLAVASLTTIPLALSGDIALCAAAGGYYSCPTLLTDAVAPVALGVATVGLAVGVVGVVTGALALGAAAPKTSLLRWYTPADLRSRIDVVNEETPRASRSGSLSLRGTRLVGTF